MMGGGVGAVRGDQEFCLVDIQQLGVDARGVGAVALVIVGNQLHLASKQATFGVDVIDPHAKGQQRRLTTGAECAGLRHAHTNLERSPLGQGC